MKNLILIRHAKSDWTLNQDDFDRTLAQKGIENTKRVAAESREFLPTGYIIFSSAAVRAKETAILFAKTLDYPLQEIQFIDALYTFDERQLEIQVRKLSDQYRNVILFGHNEAITNFVNKFGDMYIDNVPTSGFVWLKFQATHWNSIEKGTINKIIFPRDL